MDNFEQIFKRINISEIRSFLLCGEENTIIDSRSYEQILREESKPLFSRLENLYPDGKERDDFLSDIFQAIAAYEQVYMELGMKAGANLIYQLFLKENQKGKSA